MTRHNVHSTAQEQEQQQHVYADGVFLVHLNVFVHNNKMQ